MKAKTTLFISILFLFIGNIYSQNSEDLDNLGTPVYVGNVKPFSIPSSAKTKTLKTSTQTLKSFATRQTNIEWPNPGAVHIEKTAEATTTLGKWKINVLVQGKNVPKTTDVVLVIDNSGSMVGPRITSAIAAANTFVNEILTQSIDIRVAIVTINGTAVGVPTVNQGFTDDAALLNTAISSITAHDGTNLQGGFYAARQLMNSSTASRKAVILLSDGNPTYSYSSAVTTDWLLSCGNINDFNISDIDFEENHLTVTSSNYSSVSGDGQNFGTELYSQTIRCNNNDRTFIAGHHGLPTKYEARLLIDSGVDVYTIGFEVLPGGIAEKTLSGSQNKGYFTATTSNIESVYSQIRSNIAYAATNAVFSDPMSTYIVLNSNTVPTYSTFPNSTGDVVVSKGTVSFSNNGYVLNDPDIPGSGNSSLIKWKITWNIGTVSELGDQMYYFVDMAPNITPSVLYDANEQTYMDYTDVNGNTNAHQQTPEHFTIPKVSGGKGSIEIYYYTVNEAGQPINSSGTVVPVENAVKLIPGNSKYFVFNGSTALDLNQAYTVEPESAYSSNSILYQLYCTFGNVSITPTSADPNKKVWFGYIVSTPPIAADVQYCLNKTAAPLTASLSGGHTSPNYILYYFDSLNGPAQTAITPSTAVAGQTTYYVAEGKSLTCFGEKVPITVTIYPEITVSAGTPFTKTCTANINGASIGETAVTGNTYSWTSVPVGFTSADANPTVNPDQTTVYTVVKTNSASGCTATASVTITVDNSPITVSAGNPFTKTCITNIAGASIGETAVAGNIYSWTSVPAGFTSADANPTVNPDQTTVYNVVKTNFASGCTATANVTVTVDNSPITVSAGNSFTKTCTANTAGSSIGETAVIGNTYSWTSVPAGFSSADASPIVNPDQTTVYTVVKTNSTSGCTATASVTVTVDNSPITVSTGNSFTKTCTANTAGASIGETAVGGNIYSWTSVPAGFTSTEANPMVNPDQTTVYTVAKTNSASGCTATASVTVTVGNSPITVSTGNSFTKTCTANTAGASIGETAVTGNTYSWTSVPTGFSSADANPIVNPDQTTIYNVVKTNSASGCTATANVTVTVDNSPITVSAGNPFTKTCTTNTAGASIGETAVTGNTYSWTSVPEGFTSADANPTVNPDQTNIYTVVKTNSASGCTATANVTITVDNSPITVSAGNPFTKTCTANINGASIGETAVGGNIYSWTSVPAGFTSIEANPIVNPDQTTIYTVIKTNSASGCTATASVTVTVDNSPITVSTGNSFTKTCTANTAGASIGETAVAENTYSWTSVPAGFTSADANPTVNPDQTTIYTVLKTNTASGCTATASVKVTVNNSPITVSAGNPFTKTCTDNTAGASIGETVVTGNTYSWTSVPAGFSSTDANPIVNPDQTTIYTVVKTNSASGCTATASVTITVDNSPITVSAGNPFTKTCTTNTAGASIGETAVTGNTYSWTSVPAGFSSAEANPIVNPDQTTIYTVVKTNSASGCTATANVIVTVDNSPITVSAGNPFTKTCTTNTAGASIGETAVTGNTYSWTSVPAGFTSGDANPTVNPEQTTVYTVVKTNIASGCTATANVTVTVDNSSITVSAGNSFTKTCTANTAGASIGETAEIGNTYSWTSIPAGFTSTEANPIVNPDQTTIYTVIKTNSTSGCTATASVTVTVDNSPITVSTENSFTKTCTANTAGSSIGETAVTGNTYSWTSVPAGFTSTEANPIVNPDQTTVYTVVKTNSASGCTATASVTITVDNSPITVSAGNPFTKTCITNIAGASIGETAVKENTYSWTSVPVGFTSTEANPMVNPDQTTIYTVFKTNSTSGCTATASVTVKMDTAIPTLTISNPLVVCSPATVDITSNKIQTTNNGTTTKYYTTLELANLGGVSDLTTPSAINSSGIYYIRSEFTNGCFIVKPVEVSINACSIALVKQSELHNTGNCTAVGDKITYTFTITNPGTTPISNITITDPLLASPNPNVPILYVSGDTDSDDSLNSSETWTYKADYSVNQSDINVGKIINQAAVNGMVLGTNNISSLSGTDISNHNPTITELCQSPSIKITKDGNYVDSNQDGITNVGDIVSYNFVIENTGNVPLTNITVTDNNAVITTGSITTLAVGAIDTNTFSGSHAITQDDINIGYVYNLAIVTAKDPNDNPVTDTSSDPTPCTTCPIDPKCPDCTITPLTQSPGLIVIKTAVTESYSKVGDIINYSIIVKNTGNQTLHQIIVKDPLTGLNTTIAILEPNASSEYSQSYLVTQNDLDKGSVTNVATADGLTPNGTPISASDDEIVKEKTNQIDAVDDSAGPIDGINGAVNVLNVFNNDTLNAIAVNPADVKLTLVTPDAAGFMTMNTDGSIDLKDGTPAGIYTLVYQICENADLGNCDTAAVTITVICNNTAKISGHVLNLGTNTPLANVPVTLIPQKNTTGPILIRITDARGYYNFTGMIPGDYLVQVQDANLNSAYGLYPVNSSLFFTALESCKYQSHDFGYDKSDLPVLGDFVWYDVNNNGIQDEWFDANNDNLVTKNIPNQDGSFDYSKWEWIDLNGDGSYTGTLNVGELNAAGFGNAKSENIFVTGPNSYSDKVIIGIQGFWRNRPDAGAYGDYTVELKMDANLEAQASAMGATGLVKVLPSDSKKTRLSKIAKPASVEICGLTNENPQTAVVTAVDPVHLDLDFGISCKMFANIQAVDDVYNVTQCSIADEIRNAVTNDLLDGLPASISAFKFKLLTSLPQDIDISIDETGSISFLNGVAAGQYIFDYEVCEAINPANCATATITINVAPIEPITIAGPAACNGDTTPVDLSKFLPEGTPTTGTWNDSDNTRGLVGNILSTAGIPISTYKFEYKLEGECPRSIFLNVEINDDCTPLACKAIIIHNAVSANEDNKNDYFEIENLESNDCYKNFKVEIFNRWGVLVFERENYNNDANAFRGRSEGRTTINKNEGLPTGTYFYIVSYDTVDGVGKTLSIKKDGYLYLVNK